MLRSSVRYVSLTNGTVAGQEERQYAIKSFKSGAKDVMVASGVASKGLDFNDIQHVIIFSMPKEIEDYVHQIGRTGRSGKTGIATTFVNMNTPEQTLLDLKYLLLEAGQKYVRFCHWFPDIAVVLLASLSCFLRRFVLLDRQQCPGARFS